MAEKRIQAEARGIHGTSGDACLLFPEKCGYPLRQLVCKERPCLQDEAFAKYRTESVQEFRFILSEKIRQEIFFTNFMQTIETSIKSAAVLNALKRLIQQRLNYL